MTEEKKKFPWITILIVAVVLILFSLQQCELTKARRENQLQAIELSLTHDSLHVEIGKNGQLTSQIKAIEVTSNNRRDALEKAGFEIKDLRERNIRWRETNFALNAKIKAIGQGTVTLHDSITVVRVDTIPIKTGAWSDEYLSLKPILSGNKLDFIYQYQTGIKLLQSGNTVSAYLVNPNNPNIPNPYASVTTANSIHIVPTKHWYTNKWMYLGAGIVGGYFLFK